MYAGGRVVRWSKPSCSQSKCQMLFGICLWCRTESPQTVIKVWQCSLCYFLYMNHFLFSFSSSVFLTKKEFVLTAMSPLFPFQGAPVLPGKCWPFHRDQGALVIFLAQSIRITHVTLDHIPRYSSPTGDIDSAPKDFEVYVSDPSIEIMLFANFNVHPLCSRTCSQSRTRSLL